MDYRTNRKRGRDDLLHQDKAVLDLLVRGMSRDDICGTLHMPLGTVNTCCSRIYKQTGCKNRVELILKYGTNR